MYLETRDIEETMKIYQTAWEKGVKTTYYLHMKPRHTAEQSTVRVNKAEKMGKMGFAAAFMRKPEAAPASFGGITKLQPPLLTPSPLESLDSRRLGVPESARAGVMSSLIREVPRSSEAEGVYNPPADLPAEASAQAGDGTVYDYSSTPFSKGDFPIEMSFGLANAETPSPIQNIKVEVREAVAVVASAMTVSEDGSAESQSKAEAPRSALTVEQVLARANEKEKTTSAREMPQTVGTIGSEAAGPEDPQDQFICDSCQ